MPKASVSEFDAKKSKMPARREFITSIGPYILELYTGGILDAGKEGRAAIEINKKDSDGSYSKETDLKFDSKADAKEVYDKMKSSQNKVENHI